MANGWFTIEEAPNYEINDDGQVRYKTSKRCLKHHDDGLMDDPYVKMRYEGETLIRSVYVLLRQNQIDRRKRYGRS